MGPGEPAVINAMFRDTYAEVDGTESVLHEYGVRATIRNGRILDIQATPRVLPQVECPAAAAAVGDLVGEPVRQLGRRVRELLAGVRSCTHLNDLLRSLSCIPRLLALRD